MKVQSFVVKANYFGFNFVAILANHFAARANGRHDATRFHAQAHQANQGATALRG